MESQSKEIIKAYQVDKLSVQQIMDIFTVSQRFVQRTLDGEGISRRSISEAIRMHHITKFGKEPFVPKQDLTEEERGLKIAGVMLYWGEGTKEGGIVALANSDPKMVQLFMRFLRIICGVVEQRLHPGIHYYPDHNPVELIKFWSDVTAIPPEQFHKPYLHVPKETGTYRKPSAHGTILINYSDVLLLRLIRSWMVEYETLGLTTS